MDLLEKRKKNRTAAKTRLTLASNKLKDIVGNVSTKHEIVQGIENFESRLRLYDEAQSAVEELICAEDVEADTEQSELFREERIHSYVKAKEFLESMISITEKDEPINSTSHTSTLHQAKLPTIELPKFSGDHTQWQSFWDKFTAIVHVSDIPAVSKFTYLQSLLKGDALSAINGLALTEANYDTARNILENRFGKKERIVFSHLQQLLNLSITGRSTSDLWTLYDKLQTHVRSLETMGITGDKYGVILTPLVLHILPENIRLEWARLGDGRESDLEALLSFLQTEISTRERSQTFRSEHSSPRGDHKAGGRYATTSALHSKGKDRTPEGDKVFCNVCGKGHVTSKCFSWDRLDLEGRKSQCFKNGLCFLCLGVHKVRECKSQSKCKLCSGKHHSLLCNKLFNSDSWIINEADGETQPKSTASASFQVRTNVKKIDCPTKYTMLQTAQVTLLSENGGKDITVNLLFDSGSDRSYISSACAYRLGLRTIGKENISVALFGQAKPNNPKLRNKFKLNLLSTTFEKEEMIVTETPSICAPISRPKLPQDIVDKLKREGLTLATGSLMDSGSQDLIIDVLVGLDYFWQFMKPNTCRVTEHLSAQETKFGWILSGSWEQKGETNEQRNFLNYQFLCMTDVPDHYCHKFWNLEVIGIEGCSNKGEDQLDAETKILDDFNNSVTFESGRYVVHLPWKSGQRGKLVENKSMAIKRSENLTKRLGRDPKLETGYNAVFQELEEKGIIHEVSSEEIGGENPVFYLPHRPVVREASETTKIRPVFDASVRGLNGVSLNDCMETGPNLIPNLIEILLRFRRWRYGLTSDITKAFLQIKVAKEDQNVHRFIWDVKGQRRVMRFDRVIFGNACSPFLLNATIKYHLNSFPTSRVVSELTENLYVDDWLSGADTEEEIENMITSASEIMNGGSFPLSKWGSNSSAVMQNTSKGFENNNYAEICPSLKILGMYWETNEDYFYFKADPIMLEGVQYTKRLVLSFIARIYDPLGFLNPFTVMVKILFQDLWRLGLEWDHPLPTELQDKMTTWANGFRDISKWKIPRCISLQSWEGSSNMRLLCFSDASERAFGCCVYLELFENGSKKVSLVTSRVRVAPVKKITLPRLELLGALLAARLICFVKTALKLPVDLPYLCFTDSTIVLHWIKADPFRWKQFVRNRVTEIHTLTSPSNWKHIPGKENPADLLTRGVCAWELANSTEWLQAPVNLEVLDSNPKEEPNEETILSERVKKSGPALFSVQDPLPKIDFKRHSHFIKAVKVMGWVLRFINNLRVKSSTHERRNKAKDLTLDEFEEAKICLFKIIQGESFEKEIEHLTENKMITKASPLFKMSPFLDENGLLRMGGRLHMSENYTLNEKHPILLPKCHVTLLLVRFQHNLLKHAGVSTLLTCLRNNYWIFGLRVLCKKVCRECVLCKRHDARACDQVIAPLPYDRISRSIPFSVVGMDHAGPVYCLDTGGKKHYILLFTCGVIRAVHLELVPSLSLKDFMLAFRKFCARRGLPSVIYSDNAKTFEAANNLLKHFGPSAPLWKFSIPLAPWYGGWWERLVRSTKSALKKSIGRELIDRSELETVLFEVEACLNSRPLTYVEEHEGPLTPSHFLLGRSSPFNSVQADNIPQNGRDFCLVEKEHRSALEKFWRIWNEDYIRNLPSLGNGRSKVDLRVGSIVLIREEGKPRMKWPLGKVTKVIHSKDGLVRAVGLKTEKGELVRAVQKLHKLEVMEASTDRTPDENVVSTRSGRVVKPPQRF